MKGNAKKVICLFLATIIVITTAGYAPPSYALTAMNSKVEEALKALASHSEADEIVEEVATPSEAESTGDKATPSEAENPADKATPSEAVKKFVQMEPEEIPEYYSQVKKTGKRFWKFEDRNGMIQYRDYGYVNGDAEFPLWYEADQAGSVKDMSFVNLDEEYYILAPYIFKSVAPEKEAWINLSWRLFFDSFSIEEYVKKNITGFKNWDASSYNIWKLTGAEYDLGYHFYGMILNDSNNERKPNWYYADEEGNIVIDALRTNLSVQSVGPNQIKYYYADVETYPNSYYDMSASYVDNISSLGDEDYYEFRTPTLSGHTFLGWSDLMCYNYGHYKLDIRMNPQNYDCDSHIETGGFASLILPGTKLKKKYLNNRKELTAVWIPTGYESLILMRDYDFMDTNNVLHVDEYKNENWEKGIWSVSVIVRKPGVTYDFSRLPDKNNKWHSTKFNADLGGYVTEDGERITDSYTFKNKKGITYAFAEWIPSKNSVTFKDYYGNIIGEVQTVTTGDSAVPPEAPERAGYRFIGWDKSYTNIQNNIVLTAQYEIISPRLTLDGNGGTLSECSTVEMEVTVGDLFDQILANGKDHASRRYYTFDGWYTEPSGGNKYPESGNLMPDTEVTAYAHWERSSNEVIFKDWDGMTLKNQEVAIGAYATPPEVPERQGYTFIGWDKSYSNIQDHSTITAQYTINGYLLTMDGNGGTMAGNARKEQILSFNQSFDQVLKDGKNLVSRPGYSFDSWYNSASGGSSYSYSGNQMPAANVTLFAHWSPNTYKVTFDPDHVRWHGETTIEERTFDTRLGILPMPEIYGWKFTGWWTGKNGTGTEITNNSMVEPKDVVYYGKWQPETYQIHFISKAEQPEGESVQTYTVGLRYDQEFGNLPVPEEKGYIFMGWYDEDNKKVDSQTIFNPDSDAEVKTYHAGWNGKTYQIRFVYNDSDGKPVVKIVDGTYGVQIGTLPSPEKPGYTFVGWFRENGEEVTAGSWVEPGDTEYKAKWIPNKYTIHFNSNLYSMSDPQDKIVTYAQPIGDLPLLHATGYVFLGWYTESSGGSLIKETTLATLGDQIYYGHWSTGLIDNGNRTYRKSGSDGKWNTADDELWWYGANGKPSVDDRPIYIMPGGNGYYIDNGNGTYTKPGADGSWTNGTEHWSSGPDGKIGTSDDKRIHPEPTNPDPTNPEPTNPEPANPEPTKPESEKREEGEIVTAPVLPVIDSTVKPVVPDTGGTFTVNPNNPLEVTYTKPDGTAAKNEWVGDGKNWYHVDESGNLNYDWYLDGERTWYKLNKETGDKFGAALIGWNYEPMDDKRYFFDPSTTKMLTGWQYIDNKWYYFTKQNESQTYYGSNPEGWKYDPTKPGKPYGSMFQNEITPDGYMVDENGVWEIK